MNGWLGVSAAALIAGWAAQAAAQTDDYGADPGASGQAALGEPATGALEQAGDTDWFAVDLEAGQRYQMDLEGQPTEQGTLSDPLMQLFDPAGNPVAQDDDGGTGLNSRLRYTAQESGTHYVSAGAFGSNTGTYRLTVESFVPPPDDYAGDVTTSGSLTVGGTVTGEIGDEEDTDWFALDLTAGESYALELQDREGRGGMLQEPYIALYDADGQELDVGRPGQLGPYPRLVVEPERDGRYFAGVGDARGATGPYSLSLVEYTPPEDDYAGGTDTEGSIALGGSATGEIETPGDRDWFAIDLAAGERILIDLQADGQTATGQRLDTYLTLYDANGAAITGDDDGGDGFNSRLLFDPTSPGRYYLEAGGFGQSTGPYRLTVTDAGDIQDDYPAGTATEGRIAVGGSATGELELGGDADWFGIQLEAGVPYVFRLEGSPSGMGTLSDPYLGLYDAEGTSLASNDDGGETLNSMLRFTPQRSGQFFLEARGFANASGTYTLMAEQGRAGTMQFGVIEPGQAADGDNIAIVIELVSGERVTVLVPRDYLSEIGSVYIGPQ